MVALTVDEGFEEILAAGQASLDRTKPAPLPEGDGPDGL